MNLPGTRQVGWSKYFTLCAIVALMIGPTLLYAGKDKGGGGSASKPAASKPSGGAAGGAAHGPTTGSHGPTTSSHGPTTSTAGHTTTTTAGRTTTTTTHTTTTTTVHPAGSYPGGSHGAAGGGAAAAGHGAGAPARTPNGAKVAQTKSGGTVVKRSDGKIASVHDPKRNMDVHRGLDGNRRAVAERPDHSRVMVEHGGHGYVQHPYSFHGHEFARRSYYYHGAYYHRFYGRYYYRGGWINPYYPAYYYGPAFYGWAYNPWAAPVAFSWGWGGNPWYGYYGAYFTPYPVYAGPAFWLTDYMISTSLQAAYQAQQEDQQQAALSNPAPLTPDVKNAISEEVKRQIALENEESKTGAQNEPDPASSSIQRMLSDGTAHVFVAGTDLDVVDAAGSECAISQGDALQLTGQNDPNATAVNLAVLASKGGKECPKGDTVAVQVSDLQDMQNHMRETIDDGLKQLQAKQGTGGLPAAPASAQAPPVETAMAAAAPPPPPEQEVASELKQESKDADAAEQDAASDAGGPASAGAAPPGGAPPTVALGQTTGQVTSELGQPKSIMDLGPKKIYVYQDMKVTFNGGKVTDIK